MQTSCNHRLNSTLNIVVLQITLERMLYSLPILTITNVTSLYYALFLEQIDCSIMGIGVFFVACLGPFSKSFTVFNHEDKAPVDN